MPAGRPRRWQSAQELEDAIEGYFLALEQAAEMEPDKKPKPPGIFALCVHADMSYDTFLDYESGTKDTETDKFSETLKKARMKIVAFAEEQIYERTAGATFQLVNLTKKFREPHKNAQHQEITGDKGGPVQFTISPTQASIL